MGGNWVGVAQSEDTWQPDRFVITHPLQSLEYAAYYSLDIPLWVTSVFFLSNSTCFPYSSDSWRGREDGRDQCPAIGLLRLSLWSSWPFSRGL